MSDTLLSPSKITTNGVSTPSSVKPKEKRTDKSQSSNKRSNNKKGAVKSSSSKEGNKITGYFSSANKVDSTLKSPSKSPFTAKSPEKDTPAKSSSTKKSTPIKTAPKINKRKLAELEQKDTETQQNLDKLKRNLGRAKLWLQKAEERSKYVKFPVKDEDLPEVLKGEDLSKPLPLPVFDFHDIPATTVTAALGVWDFLSVFRKQLSLPAISFMDFLDLLRYNRETSVALMEVFCSPLKLILADAGILSKLHTALPRKIHFSQRFRETLNKAEIDDLSVDGVISDLDLLAQDDKFDKTYNGFKLLPKKLSPDLVDPLKWQAILRATLLRLDPVQQARRATLDVMTALKADSDAKGSVFLPSTLRKAMISGIGAMKTPMKTSIRAMDSLLSLSGSDLGEISSTSMSFLQTPKSVHQSGTHEVSKYLDKDAIFGITGDVVKPLETVVESCIALESYELHELGMVYKLAILQVLCDACYETQRIRELLEKNAEERLTRIQNMNKVSRETKEKKREEASALKDLAIQRCREINEAAAKKAEAEAAAKAKSKKGSKKGNKKKKAEIVSKKGGKNGKVSYDPTPQQLAAMLEDLIVLEALQIEEVVPDFPQEEVSDDEDDSDAEFDAIRESIRDESTSRKGTSGNLWDTERGRIKSAALRARSNDKKKARVEKRGRNLQLSLADEKLELALSTTSERDIRQALRFGEKIGLRGVDPVTKCTFCTEKMKQVYKLQYDRDTKSKDDKKALEHERALQEYFVRTSPIGEDRFHNKYWMFSCDDSAIYVQSKSSQTSFSSNERSYKGLMPPQLSPEAKAKLADLSGSIETIRSEATDCSGATSHSNSTMIIEGVDQDRNLGVLYKLYESRPNRGEYHWHVFSTNTEIWYLYDALDDRGEREKELKAAIQARFDLKEPKEIFQTTGSAYIGRKVERQFADQKPVIGTVVAWLPANDEDPAIWRVRHRDGDEEDFEEQDLIKFLLSKDDTCHQSFAADVIELVPSGNKHKAQTKGSDNNEEEWDINDTQNDNGSTPQLIDLFNSSKTRSLTTVRPNDLGMHGFSCKLREAFESMRTQLKKRGSAFLKEGKRLWEDSIKTAESVNDLGQVLKELEQVVRDVQTVDDKKDADEEALAKERKIREMKEEGWIFSEDKSDYVVPDDGINYHEYLNKLSRRYFPGFGISDGHILAFLPPEKNDGVALYHMMHDDGDSEDLEEADMLQAVTSREQDLKEVEMEKQRDNDDDEEGSNTAMEEVTESEDDEPSQANKNGDDMRLWPTSEVRNRWLEAVSDARTIAELALALDALVEQSKAFGVIEKPEEDIIAPRAAKLQNNSRNSEKDRNRRSTHTYQSPMKRRPQRQAAKAIKSYAESP